MASPPDADDYTYALNGALEGFWRAAGHRDTRTMREAANAFHQNALAAADFIDSQQARSSKPLT